MNIKKLVPKSRAKKAAPPDLPFCSSCRVQMEKGTAYGVTVWVCPICKKFFTPEAKRGVYQVNIAPK